MSSGSKGRIFPLKYFKHSRPSSLFSLIPTLTFHPRFFLGQPFLERTFAIDVDSKDHVIFQEIVVNEVEQWKLDATTVSCIGNRLNTIPIRKWLLGRNTPQEKWIEWLAKELCPHLSSPPPSWRWLTELPLRWLEARWGRECTGLNLIQSHHMGLWYKVLLQNSAEEEQDCWANC